ncbi:MAG: acyl carrier protein [Clostridia bacterium]|nr:acyl carrier protein [Clostridia bacterium]
MDKRKEIADRLKEILIYQNPGDTEKIKAGTEESGLLDYFGLSSVGMIYMIIVIENDFGVSFDGSQMNDFKTLGDVVSFIEAQIG